MKNTDDSSRAKTPVQLILSALRSTLIIIVVALTVASLRSGRWHVAEWGLTAIHNWRWWLMIFFALLIWTTWFERIAKSR